MSRTLFSVRVVYYAGYSSVVKSKLVIITGSRININSSL